MQFCSCSLQLQLQLQLQLHLQLQSRLHLVTALLVALAWDFHFRIHGFHPVVAAISLSASGHLNLHCLVDQCARSRRCSYTKGKFSVRRLPFISCVQLIV